MAPSTEPAPEAAATAETVPRVPREVMQPPAEPGLYVNEVFTSLQGEGRTSGLPTTFLRTMGCHLRCSWCDTTYSFHEGSWMPWDDLLYRLTTPGIKRLCLTGGEPLLQRDAWPLVRHLLADGWEISIETSGSLVCAEASAIRQDMGPNARARLCLSMDVKCPGSGEQRSFNRANLKHLTRHDQLKFIVTGRADYEFARDWLAANTVPCPVYLHPVGGRGGELLGQLSDWVLEDRLDVHVGVQLHKLLWGDTRGV